MATATITAKGQVTIPKSVRDRLRLRPGDRVEFILQDNGTTLMVPSTLSLAELKAAIPSPPRALTRDEIDQTVRTHAAARARRRAVIRRGPANEFIG